jgi:hypothetical protein
MEDCGIADRVTRTKGNTARAHWNDAEDAAGAKIAAEMNAADAANASAKSHMKLCGDRFSISGPC